MKEYLTQQPSLVDVAIPGDSKFTVCGDIHGQYYDLMNIFRLNGVPSETNPYVSFVTGSADTTVSYSDSDLWHVLCKFLMCEPQIYFITAALNTLNCVLNIF